MLISGLSVFPLILKRLCASGGSLSTGSTSSLYLIRTMNVWSGQFFHFVQSKQFGIFLIPVFKKLFVFFQTCFSTGRSCTELSWAWAPEYSGTMTGTATDICSILGKWPVACPCCCAGCGELKCTGELAREKMQSSALLAVPSLCVLV